MPVRTPPVFEAEVSPADFTFLNRRGFLLGLSALVVPKRMFFLPPRRGWPQKRWACIAANGGFYFDSRLLENMEMVITPIVRFRDMAEAVGFEPTRGTILASSRGSSPISTPNARLHYLS